MKPLHKALLALLLLAACVCPAGAKQLRVFILAGQSNMEGQGFIAADPKRNEGKGSLEYLVKNGATADRFKQLVDKDGNWAVRDDVWITYLDRKGPLTVGYGVNPDRIGPELGFGWAVARNREEPVLLIKCAWGGKSLAVDFRPPSSGKVPYPLNPKLAAEIEKDPEIVGKYYRETLRLTNEALANLKESFPDLAKCDPVLSGFGWHQGWNDRIDNQFNAEYENNLANFIRDMRRELKAPGLPFVIAETGMDGPEEKDPRALSLMKAQAAVADYPEFKGNVAFVGTRAFWRSAEESPTSQGYHWNTNAETYYLIGRSMGEAMKSLAGENLPPLPTSHTMRQIEGWTVRVDDRLLNGDGAAVGERALKLLSARLFLISMVVREKPLAKLREVTIQLDLTHGALRSMQYHPSAEWLKDHGYSEQLARCVHIPDARDFISPFENHRGPWVVLHELAHAYHDQVLGFDEPRIIAAYNKFRDGGRYKSVLTINGTLYEHYALTNEKEFFAEMTECYFGTNDFYPFVAGELKQAEPEIFALWRDIWGPLPER